MEPPKPRLWFSSKEGINDCRNPQDTDPPA